MAELVNGDAFGHCQRDRVDQLARVRGHHHSPDDDAGDRQAEQFHEAVVQPLHLRAGIAVQFQHDRGDVELAGVDLVLGDAHGGNLGRGEHVGTDRLQVQRGHRITQRVPHRDSALHGGHRGQREHPGAVAGGIDPPSGGAADLVSDDVAGVGQLHACFFQPQALGVGNGAHGHQAMGAAHLTAVLEGDHHLVPVAVGAGGACLRPDLHASALEHVLEHPGGVLILTGQHLLAGGHQHHLDTELVVGAGELGAGYARTDHDQSLGQLGQVVDLLPVQDPLTVAAGGVELARRGAGGDQDDVGLQHLLGAIGQGRDDPFSAVESSGAVDHPNALVNQLASDVLALRAGQGHHPLVDGAQVDLDAGGHRVVVPVPDVQAEFLGAVDVAHHLRRGNQGLGRHTVGQHCRPAQAVAFDQGDLTPQLGSDKGSLVAAGSSAKNHNAGHAPIQSSPARPSRMWP